MQLIFGSFEGGTSFLGLVFPCFLLSLHFSSCFLMFFLSRGAERNSLYRFARLICHAGSQFPTLARFARPARFESQGCWKQVFWNEFTCSLRSFGSSFAVLTRFARLLYFAASPLPTLARFVRQARFAPGLPEVFWGHGSTMKWSMLPPSLFSSEMWVCLGSVCWGWVCPGFVFKLGGGVGDWAVCLD